MHAVIYQRELYHKGLNKYRLIKGYNSYDVDQKAQAVWAQWEAQWQRQQEREQKAKEREQKLRDAEESTQYALDLTKEAEELQKNLDNILLNSLQPSMYDYEKLKNKKAFSIVEPTEPIYQVLPKEPEFGEWKYVDKPSFLFRLSKKVMEQHSSENEKRYHDEHKRWEDNVKTITKKNEDLKQIYIDEHSTWESEKRQYIANQEEQNLSVDEFIKSFHNGEVSAVEKYFSLLLEDIKYPIDFKNSVEIELDPDTQNMIIDMLLPTIEDIPNLKSVAYVKSRNDFKKSYLTESYCKKKYDSVVYQIVLQVLNYIFKAISIFNLNAYIQSVTINGKIQSIDKATGKNIEPYLLSVYVKKEEFENLNLEAIDPKTWFKSAKGISAASIANVTPIAPVVKMSREDHRFIESYSVVDEVDESLNLASMDWQDFENLIREIFEKEFNVNGGEVKITQASRDGGVDAVAFDPDPIRGGKIVIQAKRYTNVVGVSAVRDLYGTVMNEGANKGILVTTSNFGNDAYQFAQGKPLTLMNGANLLYLLEKHGHKARIDINEAKKTLGLNNKKNNY